jgi:uncharacterized membrane protein
MFEFGCITLAVIDDVIIFITCYTPKSMDILGDNLANIHISVGSVFGTWMGDGKSMMRWGWDILIIIIIIVVIIIIESIILGEKRGGISRIIDSVTGESVSIIERKGAG